MPSDTLAVDFGTSNSAAAVLVEDRVRRIPIEDGAETLPTAVFFPADGGAMRIGAAATDALIGDRNNGWAVTNTTLAFERAGLGAGGGHAAASAATKATREGSSA